VKDYESIQRRRNIIVGLFVVTAVCAIMWLIFKFGDLPVKVSEIHSFQVFVQFPKADGVQKDTPVRFCGYQIGRVIKIKAPERLKDLKTGLEYHQTVAVLGIDKKYANIPSNVNVKVMTRGLGSSYIEFTLDPELPLAPRDPNRPETIYLVDKMLLQGATGMTSEFFPEESQKKLDQLADKLDKFVSNANDIFGDSNNKKNIKATLANLSEATKQASQTLKEFQKFSATSTVTLRNVDNNIEKVGEELSEMMSQLSMILEKVNSGQGTAGKLINDGQLYENLLENTEQLQSLLEELESFLAKANKKGLPIKLK